MTRILVTTDAVGGIWRYSMELCSAWVERGVCVTLAVVGPPPDAAQRAEAGAMPRLVLIETGLGLDWTAPDAASLEHAAAALANLAREGDVDAVHLHAPALIGNASWPVPVVAVMHSCLLTWWRALRMGPVPLEFECRIEATRTGLRRADAVLAPSHAFAADVRAAYELGRTIDAVHNGRRCLALPDADRKPGVFAAGRLWDEAKNLGALDRVAAHLPARVTVAGEKRAPHGGEAAFSHVRNAGSLDAAGLAKQLAGNSVFAGISLYEPFGLTVLEAAQSGMALVLSDIAVFRELWDDAALFVDARDTAAIKDGLLAALAEPERHAQKSKMRAADFSRERMADATLAIHARLCGTAAAA